MKKLVFFLLVIFSSSIQAQNVLFPSVTDTGNGDNVVTFKGELVSKEKCSIQFGDAKKSRQLHIIYRHSIISILTEKKIKAIKFFKAIDENENAYFQSDYVLTGKMYITDVKTSEYRGGDIGQGKIIISYNTLTKKIQVVLDDVRIFKENEEHGLWKSEDPNWKIDPKDKTPADTTKK